MVILVMFHYIKYTGTFEERDYWLCDLFRIWFPGGHYTATCQGMWSCISTPFYEGEPF